MTWRPLVSVCMPMYNAAPFVAEAIERILAQSYDHLELVVVDNCSTDGSADIARSFAERDPRVRVVINRCNIGYAGNLDKATALARGDLMMMHCADDTAERTAIEHMVEVFARPDVDRARTVVVADTFVMNPDGAIAYVLSRDPRGFRNLHIPIHQYRATGTLDRFNGATALAGAMARLKTVGFQGAMLYPRSMYEAVEGVRNGRLSNPDKHFTYKLLAQDPEVIWIREPLFTWRLHDSNQEAVERAQGAIKKSLDDYIYTFEHSQATLDTWGVKRADMIRAFVDESCLAVGLKAIADGHPSMALRYVCFSLATYPGATVRNPKFYAAAAGMLSGPVGRYAARLGYRAGIWRAKRPVQTPS